ncbi:hypothetical protein DPMN_087128 [Dreissena polymorpha]|uniref:Uncharacterized protein n=1 Tax=Dreissena polymorpha TaxID=45954 RepID=A0A9D4QV72_DREPO|nr:hypothetical protein DPMN_087128 [Dreissena polymorpha]
MISNNGNNVFNEKPFALCVKFVREEAYCAPYILLFEMNRGISEVEVAKRHDSEKDWMNCAEVDARPFLHYLQYLTYVRLGEPDKQLHAMGMLESYLFDLRYRINIYHKETAMHLLAHCHEMEGDYERALDCYDISLRCLDTNNAAH